ncbi:MAG: enoyl-CoA hydratase [Caldilineaceae bacterium]|nr:enoyl-CoA hydratase [Caldilineaceae bacterium]
MSDLIVRSVADGVMTVRINRPEKKNALTVAMYDGLSQAIAAAEGDDAVRVLLLTGTDGVFSAGNDIMDFLQWPPFDESSPVVQFLMNLTQARKPIVAAVQGPAVGIGTTMLLHCDLVYAGAGTRFQLPFVNLGLVPEAGSSVILPAGFGYQRAAELLMLGEPFDAQTAQAAGFVTAIYPDDEVSAAAAAVAGQLAAKPPQAVRLTKALLKRATAPAVSGAIQVESGHFAALLQSPEAEEAFTAFMERRKPDFSRFV